MSERKRGRKQSEDPKEDVEVINVSVKPGQEIHITPSGVLPDEGGDSKQKKDAKRTLSALEGEILNMQKIRDGLEKDIQTSSKRRKASIEKKLTKLRDEVSVLTDKKEHLHHDIAELMEEIEKCHAAEAKSKRLLEKNTTEYISMEKSGKAREDLLKKQLDALVLSAKNKVKDLEGQYGSVGAKYRRMEEDIKAFQKEKESFTEEKKIVDAFRDKMEARFSDLTRREEELTQKEAWFKQGQEQYRESYRQKEAKFIADSMELRGKIEDLKKAQKDLAENWDILKKEKLKIELADKNKKRVG